MNKNKNKKYNIDEYNKYVKQLNSLNLDSLNFDELSNELLNQK